MVGEVCAHVQGESLKAQATFLSEVYQLPGHQDGGSMRVIRILMMTIGGFAIALSAIWFLAGYGTETEMLVSENKAVAIEAPLQTQRRVCAPEEAFHLERLQANESLKVVALGEQGVSNVQRFLNMTVQNPLELSQVPRVKVWVAWQYAVQSLGGSAPAQGVIDVVQDGCVIYRRQGEAAEIVAIVNGEWSR